MFLLAQMPTPQLPPLPEGPALENVRGPIELNGGYETWQIALAALAVLLIAAGLIWLYLHSRKKPAALIPPEEAALAELNAASQAADDERFALLCANAIRRFLASKFNLPANSQTSAELGASLPLDEEEKSTVLHFLESCDAVKFAGQGLSEDQRIELLNTAKELIQKLNRKEGMETT